MDKKQALYTQYEDALFSVLMNEIAEEEGKRLLEESEALNANNQFFVPEVTTKRCLIAIEKEYDKTRNRNRALKIVNCLNRIALVALIPIILFVGVFASSESFRTSTLNFLIDEFDLGTRFSYNNAETSPSALNDAILSSDIIYVPHGYSLFSEDNDKYLTNYVYTNEENDSIVVSSILYDGISGEVIIDTEDADVFYEMIADTEVMIAHEDFEYRAIWNANDTNFIVVIADNLDYNEFMNILRSIIQK